jgi:4-amino-4-deoxy-L-arabinose transferase-like glycosyltransferase
MTATSTSDAVAPHASETPAARTPASHTFVAWLAAFSLLGLVVRIMNVLWWRATTTKAGYHGYKLGGDAYFYHWQANALAKGAWFIDPGPWVIDGIERPSAGHPPMYSIYLALWSALGLDGVTAHRLASSMLGVASIVVVGLLARRIAGDGAGLVAAAIMAVYPEIWINDGMLLSETMAIFMTAVALTAAYAFWQKPTTRSAILLGLAFGGAALSRSELLLLFPIVVIPLALLARELSRRKRIRLAVIACVVGACTIAPWIIFNMARFEESTTMSSGTGAVLSAASCDEVWYGLHIGYYANCFTGPWPAPGLDESQRDVEPRRQAIEYTKDHITRLPLVAAARVGRLWGLFKPGQTTALDWWIEGRGRAASWVGLFMYYALLPFAIYGLVVMRRRRIPILPLIAIAVTATLAAAATFGVTRYRAPAEVSLVVAAAVGIAVAWERWRSRTATTAPSRAATP